MKDGTRPIWYAGGHLDRAGDLRNDPAWVIAQLEDPSASIVPMWRNRNLIDRSEADPRAVMLERQYASKLLLVGANTTFLGLEDKRPFFAIDLSANEEAKLGALIDKAGFLDLRIVGPRLPMREAALLAYARGMLHWHRHHRHCGKCGNATESRRGGHMRLCGNPDCGHETHPRTDPAVIMLVEHRASTGIAKQCVLGRQQNWPPGCYSTLAGFVDPGESLEEAVAREVLEEVGLEVTGTTYLGSQPWPFPSSLMLGFRTRVEKTELTIDNEELGDARWFTAKELGTAGEWGDSNSEIRLPRKDSIARYLVDSWLADTD